MGDGAVGKVCDGEFFYAVGIVLLGLLDMSFDFVYNECIPGMIHVNVVLFSSQRLIPRANIYQPVRLCHFTY